MITPTNIEPPPMRDVFSTPGVPGIQVPWAKWFQSLVNSIQTQIAAIVQSQIQNTMQAGLPSTLPASAEGVLYNVTDYGHLLQWNGTNWTWGPGEPGSGQIQPFLTAPTGAGWHLCDGSTVNRLNSDGTITAVHLPDYTTAAYLKLGNTEAAGPNAASGLTQAVSAGTPAGTVSAPTFTGTPVTPIFTGASDTTSVESADATVQSGAGATVAAQNHTHTVTPTGTVSTITPAGTNSVPTFTGAALATHSHGPGTLDLRNTTLLPYFRQ